MIRLARYLSKFPILEIRYKWQDFPGILNCFSDSDWAGCLQSRRSTSGGRIFFGKHWIRHWSKLQPCVSLSSAEAEFYSMVRCVSEGMGIQGSLRDIGINATIHSLIDASAARGNAMRKGSGRIKHLEAQNLRVQEKVNRGLVKVI